MPTTDTASIERAADSFGIIAGVSCHFFVLNGELPEAGGDGSDRERCSICESLLAGKLPMEVAGPEVRFAAYQAERLAGRYVYFCPSALLHVVSPVVGDEEMIGAFVAGPAMLGASHEEVADRLRSRRPGSLLTEQALAAWVDSLPEFGPREANALSDALLRIAATFCDHDYAELMLSSVDRRRVSAVVEYLPSLRSMEGDASSDIAYPINTERELVDAVTAGDRVRAQELLKTITRTVLAAPIPDEAIVRSRVLEIVVLISRAAIAGGADVEQVFGVEFRSLTNLRRLSSIDQIASWLSRTVVRFTDLVFDLRHLRYSAHLSRAVRSIHERYRESISLAEVAREVGVSGGYLQRLFRKELRTTYVGYLREVRLREARRLLSRTRLPIAEVAAEVGFEDPSYFALIFRRWSGMTPREYRERHAYLQ